MATLTISLPDEVLQEAKKRLAGRGDDAVEQYLLSAIHVLAMDGTPIDAETEAALLEGLESPAREMTEADWEEKLRQYDQRHPPKGNGEGGG